MACGGPVKRFAPDREDGFQPWYWIEILDMDYELAYEQWAELLLWAKTVDNQHGKQDVKDIRFILAQIAEKI